MAVAGVPVAVAMAAELELAGVALAVAMAAEAELLEAGVALAMLADIPADMAAEAELLDAGVSVTAAAVDVAVGVGVTTPQALSESAANSKGVASKI